MSRLSWDELRAKTPKTGRYAGTPGEGPAGKTCRSCRHKTYSGHGPKYFPKCGLTRWTHGDATTIKTSTPACRFYEEAKDGR